MSLNRQIYFYVMRAINVTTNKIIKPTFISTGDYTYKCTCNIWLTFKIILDS